MRPTLRNHSNEQQAVKHEQYLAISACILVTFLVITEVVRNKNFLLVGIPVSCRDIVYPLTFLIINITAEIYGLQHAKALIMHGLSVSIVVIMLLWIAQSLPVAHNSPVSAHDFDVVLRRPLGSTIDLLAVYLIGQLLNLHLFMKVKKMAKQCFWLRTIVTSLCIQLIDIILLITVLYVANQSTTGQVFSSTNFLAQYALRALSVSMGTLLMYIIITLGHQQLERKVTQ